MKNLIKISSLFILLLFLNGCCTTYNGYGRYTMTPNCTKVTIDGDEYQLTQRGSDFVIDQHTLSRGIYRKTRPWLYVHKIDSENEKINVTFDEGKGLSPLYTGTSASIGDVYRSEPWEIEESTVAEFEDNYWLVSHIFSEDGIYFDLQQNLDPETNLRWKLVQGNIFVNKDGTPTEINDIGTRVKITDFDYGSKTATVEFSEM